MIRVALPLRLAPRWSSWCAGAGHFSSWAASEPKLYVSAGLSVWALSLAHYAGIWANILVFQLDLLNDGSNLSMKNLQLPVEIDVLSKVPE